MKKLFIISALVLFGMGCEQSVDTAPERDARTERAHSFVSSRVDNVLDEVDASDDQRSKINTIKDRMFDKMLSLKTEGKDVKREALDEWRKDEPDMKKIHGMIDERFDVWRAAMHDAVNEIREAHAVMTPEQRNEIADMIEERMDKHSH